MEEQNKKKEQEEPKTYVRIGDIEIASQVDSLANCSKIALNLHRLRNEINISQDIHNEN